MEYMGGSPSLCGVRARQSEQWGLNRLGGKGHAVDDYGRERRRA